MAVVGSGWDVPPEADSIGDFRWFKVTPGRVIHLVVLSREPMHYLGHFVNGRMIPCADTGCVYCENGVGRQLRWVFACVEPFSGQVGMMELGRSVGLELRAKSDAQQKFKGLVLKFWRAGKSIQSRLEMDVVDMKVSNSYLALPCPDVGKAMKMTWQRSGRAVQEVLDEVGDATPSALEAALRQVREKGSGRTTS